VRIRFENIRYLKFKLNRPHQERNERTEPHRSSPPNAEGRPTSHVCAASACKPSPVPPLLTNTAPYSTQTVQPEELSDK
jgi:hypothetical protein